MELVKKIGLVAAIAAGVGLSACAAEPASVSEDEGSAPAVEVDSLVEETEGTSYNGWTQTPDLLNQLFCSWNVVRHNVNRISGDTTRGGGACYVRKTATSCSSDSTCISAAQSQYGSSAWGYCYAGTCYHRPGSQTDLCALNPNRTSGWIWKNFSTSYYPNGIGDPAVDFAVGCMTKTAGPNTACGGTDTSLYMRSVDPLTVDTWSCFPF